jgi:hypothetical protein
VNAVMALAGWTPGLSNQYSEGLFLAFLCRVGRAGGLVSPRIPPPRLVSAAALQLILPLTDAMIASLPSHEIDGVKRYDPVAAYDLARTSAPLAKPPSWDIMPDAAPGYLEEGGKRYCTIKVAETLTGLSNSQLKTLARAGKVPSIRRKVRRAGSPSVYLLVEAVEEYAKTKSRKARGQKRKCNVQSATLQQL